LNEIGLVYNNNFVSALPRAVTTQRACEHHLTVTESWVTDLTGYIQTYGLGLHL